MKQLFFATSFAITAFAGYAWVNAGHDGYGIASKASLSEYSLNDTTPKKKKDSTQKWGKDSLNRKDSTWPKKDSTTGQ